MSFVSPPHRPRQLRRSLAGAALVLGLGAAALAPIQSASSAPAPQPVDGVYDVLGKSWGVPASEAKARLDAEHRLANALETAQAQLAKASRTAEAAPGLDGAFFDADRRLVVNVHSAEAAATAKAHGLTPRTVARGEKALAALQTRVQALADRSGSTQVQSIGADLPTDRLKVVLQPGARTAKTVALVKQLTALPGVDVSTSTTTLAMTADVIGGQIMDLVPGSNCSLGYPGTLSNGNNVLLTAGHCVEGNPDVLNRSGVHIGKGIASRFRTGYSSVDMGLMDIDAEDVGRGYIDNRNGTTTRVTGSSKAPVGSTICKAGNTTGWTCGTIQQYNVTVNYGGAGGSVTRTSGLARSTVCTEGGDSGGAYISGTIAQGMTSGGPSDGHDCGFNQGGNATGSYSFYQPVVDAASYYGVTLTRG
ncbi:peptidase S1 and S6 chymotrypsin/Hap [Kribbella flavida DSM 17836]|uniref:Peptidase S1 and S6 chymotrypsin/Hap n=1 Tax=Kribbella flavida (strain DSM 17836 / JCM 10339 / NBRC 14399) TaxID=479435 RepID=D2PYH3_KRIFD|nr:S1 family peptidase [Kribbella flavida]ADB35541.1 peptidase S1 and S6 chymotrypsin/Hap [Kribbella flavida DSM 17836]